MIMPYLVDEGLDYGYCYYSGGSGHSEGNYGNVDLAWEWYRPKWTVEEKCKLEKVISSYRKNTQR